MKPKKFEKKLALNKRTIATLDGSQMKVVKGGTFFTVVNTCQFFKCKVGIATLVTCDYTCAACDTIRTCDDCW